VLPVLYAQFDSDKKKRKRKRLGKIVIGTFLPRRLRFLFFLSESNWAYSTGNTTKVSRVAVMFSKFIEMRNNTFRNNWGMASFGLLLKEINDA
ncbi:hypothetical protein F3C99_17635, partial [Vitellibacter sp. q18]|nr:hypothetical protein [Aequorivita lutea]